jgi:hypothetical protein
MPFVLIVLVLDNMLILWQMTWHARRTRLRPTQSPLWRGVETLHSITGTTQDLVAQDLAGGGGSSWA